jgi:hypothetical protein
MSVLTLDSRVVTSCALAVSSHSPGLAGLGLEVGQLDAQLRDVEHLLDAGQGDVERGELVTAVGGHEQRA